MSRRHCHPHCGCGPKGPIVHPVKENVVHCCTEETVKHIHPSHTTVKNHHLIKNEHLYPHSTSVENYCDCVDINKGNPCMPAGNKAAGAMHYGKDMHYGKGMHHGMHPGMKYHPHFHKWN